ncbi:MAG: HTH-type transcriptional regulator [Caulobacter sp.]|nr:HTH-type transcriptional regulator [Caulobacter sp.]
MRTTGLTEYEALDAVARLKNFRAAARELRISPSALSNAIRSLEARLGVRLFNRTTRSVALTEAGEQFVTRLSPALAEIEAAVEAVNGQRATPSGTLRINTHSLAGREIIAPVVAEYLRRYPQMKLEIATTSAFVDIVAGGFDAGIRLADTLPKDMIGVSIAAAESRVVVGTPGYFEHNPIPRNPKDLLGHRCILTRVGGGAIWPWPFQLGDKRLGLDVQGPLIVDEPNVGREAVLAGIGLYYINEFLVADDIATGRLIRVLEDWTPSYAGMSLYYPGRRHVPAGLRAFIDVIRDVNRRGQDAPAERELSAEFPNAGQAPGADTGLPA